MKKYLGIAFLFLVGCKETDDFNGFPAGNFSPIASLNANLSSSEPFGNYENEYKAIRSIHAKGAQTAAPWASLNPTGVTYDFAPIANPIFGLNALAGYGYEVLFLNIPIITIDKRSMPADIVSKAFDDPIVKSRFHALLDTIKNLIHPNVKYIALGNEVDTYFSTHPDEWTAYQILIEDAKDYLKSLKPNLQVGVTTTFDGAAGSFFDHVKQLNTNMDVCILTYYPIDNKFNPRNPGTVKDDVAKMILAAQDKQIVMQEWGYPSSTALGSSERLQAEFIYNSLVELEKQGASKFPFISFFKYRDWNTNHVQSITGQSAGQPFFEFMSSLGLKRNDGTSKEAFTVLESWIQE